MSSVSRHFKWSFPPRDCAISGEEVHVWVADLEQAPRRDELAATLSPDEKEKAARFHFERDRESFIAGRGLLRSILSCYTKKSAGSLEFAYEKNGKPRLARPMDHGNLNFNLSHSGGLALYVIAQNRALGIDLENVHSFSDMDDVAARCFLPEEQSTLRSLQPPQKEENFFRYWTRKEAQLKCSGDGFSADAQNEARFDGSLLELEPASGYIAALAVRGQPFALKKWQWQDVW
ncbi:MAG: 4'-phosphopantetheinyl transferase superfamily protein [Verrucomicrobiota bacterium]